MKNTKWFKRPLVMASICSAFAAAAGGAAWAASMSVSSASLGAGTNTISTCQTDTLGSQYTTSDTGTGYKITVVTLSNVDAAACAGKVISVTVSDGTVANAGSGSSTSIVTGTSSYAITLTPSVSESAATHLDIEIK